MKRILILFFIIIMITSASFGYILVKSFYGTNEAPIELKSDIVDKAGNENNKKAETSSHAPNTNEVQKETPRLISMSFGGDVLLDRGVASLIENKGAQYIFSDVKEVFDNSDITMVNLENPVSTLGVKENDKQYTFRAKPDYLESLTHAGIDIVTLANNHVLDFGVEALFDTFKHLKNYGISYVGAGEDIDRASEPFYMKKHGYTIAFIGSSHVIPFPSWAAGKNKPGVATTYNPERIRKEISQAREKADIVIVYVHWGEERKTRPLDYQRNLGKIYIESGADVVIGAHPHVLQGFEYYKGRLIAYSLGNFVFTNQKKDTIILNISFNDKGIDKAKAVACEIINCKPFLIKDQERSREILKSLDELSYNTEVHSDGLIVAK